MAFKLVPKCYLSLWKKKLYALYRNIFAFGLVDAVIVFAALQNKFPGEKKTKPQS